jgi:hypothetical protein
MELRSRIPAYARRAALMAAFGALLAPATAGAATAHASKAKRYPVITSVSPMNANIGDTITIRGRYFKPGRGKNSVVFKRDGGRAVFVKADVGTKKLLKVKLPAKLTNSLSVVNGAPTTTRFRLRVLARRLGKSFTRAGKSPRIGPLVPPPPPSSQSALDPDGDCDGDKVTNRNDADDDNDGLEDEFERTTVGTDGCKFDTDGDKVSDGFEYRSAVDLNNDDYRHPAQSLQFPGKRPYPNALDGEDAGTDYDGDGLTLGDEYGLWQYTIGKGASASLDSLTYSDGLKASKYTRDANGIRRPALAAAGYDKAGDFTGWMTSSGYVTVQLPDENDPGEAATRPLLDFDRTGIVDAGESNFLDRSGDGWLTDDERDEDADGLSNWAEMHGTSTPSWWKAVYKKETPFRIGYAGTSAADADTDGDNVRDGADDQDFDGYPNIVELSRSRISGRPLDPPNLDKALASGSPSHGRVQPFNPCLPYVGSRTCPTYIPVEDAWAPFDGPPWNPDGSDPNYLVLN